MSWEFFNQAERKANKEHRCDQCHGKICVGEQYSYAAGKYEGVFQTNHEHLSCLKAWQELRDMRMMDNYDEAPLLIEDTLEPEELAWLVAHHQEVYDRAWQHFNKFYRPKIVPNSNPSIF